MFNLLYYLPVAYNCKLKAKNETLICDFNNHYSQGLISYMDLANRSILQINANCTIFNITWLRRKKI